ncbi:Lrp/AsnC family transcriptional regulator [Pseudoalteromonas denitrificans]|uniref:Leucine-responsive regulatory protein n=1 Tax=Pseudoalteromonas denitrificans DSM 6059 TaxID=1123010 RepID=A0A1I1KLP1_9GAMM|nr:Lrp/AsnC family transcriptional regulator [Pseudoalteromonas denitrificans]SFC61707.1 transcriptional regulator, AsnC family [Pseudoalteromonas denitrificans DSM 6059]
MIELDKISKRILRELELNGRISNAELANRVGLSASACLRRVQELERLNIIKGYKAVLNQTELGIGCIAYVAVGLSSHTKDAQVAFESAITLSPEVKECHNITGPYEYLLRVETTDLIAYKKFHTDVLGTSAHVASITTHVVMGSPKDDRA